MKPFALSLVFLGFLLQQFQAFAQIEAGGIPRSFRMPENQLQQLEIQNIATPDLQTLRQEDVEDSKLQKPYRVGISVPVEFNLQNSGLKESLFSGGSLWRLHVRCPGAEGIGINFSTLELPQGCDLFVYSPDKHNVLGAFTQNLVHSGQGFAVRPVAGDEIILELFLPDGLQTSPQIQLSELSYIYRNFISPSERNVKSTASGICEVDINCSEGDDWQNQKSGILRILTKVGSKYFYCSGSLVNNTSQDYSGLLLTASHCARSGGSLASAADLEFWVFYFNYDAEGCNNVAVLPDEQSIVGAEQLAIAGNVDETGSDFLLLRSLDAIPPKYFPFYVGWNTANQASGSGVCIHHPDGDVKKISTYNTTLKSGTWAQTPESHWIVQWSPTENGYGVTEGGSSGSPLFNNLGQIIGILTGGESSCVNKQGEDFFGKFSYSWVSNGPLPEQQLKPWLDPENTGLTNLPGTLNLKYTVAEFTADRLVIPIGSEVNFYDLSTGQPDSWHWYFQAASPSESTEQNPQNVRFTKFGACNVKLIVSNQYNSDTLIKEGFIDVKAVVSPNPTHDGIVNILLDPSNQEKCEVEVFNSLGQRLQEYEFLPADSGNPSIKLPDLGIFYILKLKQGNSQQSIKVLTIPVRDGN